MTLKEVPDRVLEWGIVSIQGENLLDAKTRLCGTKKSIDVIDSEQHGITSDLVAKCPDFAHDFCYLHNFENQALYVLIMPP